MIRLVLILATLSLTACRSITAPENTLEEGFIARTQQKACHDILGTSCDVMFEPSTVNYAWATCYPENPHARPQITWGSVITDETLVRDIAYHEACHHYWFRRCGCPYAPTGGEDQKPPRGTQEGDANACRDRWVTLRLLPDWDCPAETPEEGGAQ